MVLKLRSGCDICFTATEFQLYQHLFKISDSLDIGTISEENPILCDLLSRTNIPLREIRRIFDYVVANTNTYRHNSNTERRSHIMLNLHRWLILCKIIALAQCPENAGCIDDDLFRRILEVATPDSPSTDDEGPIFVEIPNMDIVQTTPANFSFCSTKYLKQLESKGLYQCVISEWIICSDEGYQGQHVKFRMVTEIQNNNIIDGLTQQDNEFGMESMSTFYRAETMRRFSDFEAFVNILSKAYKGIVVPPLPPKTWAPNISDAFQNQRSKELQLFLAAVTSHPILRQSFELRVFLESSQKGFKAFRDLFPRVVSGSIGDTVSPASTLSASVSGAASTAVSAISTLWGSVARNVGKVVGGSSVAVGGNGGEGGAGRSENGTHKPAGGDGGGGNGGWGNMFSGNVTTGSGSADSSAGKATANGSLGVEHPPSPTPGAPTRFLGLGLDDLGSIGDVIGQGLAKSAPPRLLPPMIHTTSMHVQVSGSCSEASTEVENENESEFFLVM